MIDWDAFYEVGVGVMGIQPSEFLQMTPREFRLAMNGRMGKKRPPDYDELLRVLEDEEYGQG